ncbi:DUF2057 family protein [Motilimonas sp. KMU-193]|uniref:DUF2057 family protein n=1 Tax=Motilimonas sp. KMU-193 TaxID=3388668 RepID=UPI00396B18E7
MIKSKSQSLVLISLLALTACAANPNKTSSDEFASNTTVSDGFSTVDVVGEKVRAIPQAGSAPGLTRGEYYIQSSFAKNTNDVGLSEVYMDISYFKQPGEYEYVYVGGTREKLKPRKVTSETCNENCTLSQWFKFSVPTDLLVENQEKGLTFEIRQEHANKGLKFLIAPNYIQGIVKRIEGVYLTYGNKPQTAAAVATTAAVSSTATNSTVAEKRESTAVEMTRYWFNKVSSAEQEAFISWALKNRKKVTSTLDAQSKEMEMLAYWFNEATEAERAELLTWTVENIN